MYKVKTIVLPEHYTLMDVAYIYTWKREAPMRYYYRVRSHESTVEELPEVPIVKSSSLTVSDSRGTTVTIHETAVKSILMEQTHITTTKIEGKTEQVSELASPMPSERKVDPKSLDKVKSDKSESSKKSMKKVKKDKNEKTETGKPEIKLIIDIAKQKVITEISCSKSDVKVEKSEKTAKHDRSLMRSSKSDSSKSPKSPKSPKGSKSPKVKTPPTQSPISPIKIKTEPISPKDIYHFDKQCTPEKLDCFSSKNISKILEDEIDKEKSEFFNSFGLTPKKSLSPVKTPFAQPSFSVNTPSPSSHPSIKITLSKRKNKDATMKGDSKKSRLSPDDSKNIFEYKIKEEKPPTSPPTTICTLNKSKHSPSNHNSNDSKPSSAENNKSPQSKSAAPPKSNNKSPAKNDASPRPTPQTEGKVKTKSDGKKSSTPPHPMRSSTTTVIPPKNGVDKETANKPRAYTVNEIQRPSQPDTPRPPPPQSKSNVASLSTSMPPPSSPSINTHTPPLSNQKANNDGLMKPPQSSTPIRKKLPLILPKKLEDTNQNDLKKPTARIVSGAEIKKVDNDARYKNIKVYGPGMNRSSNKTGHQIPPPISFNTNGSTKNPMASNSYLNYALMNSSKGKSGGDTPSHIPFSRMAPAGSRTPRYQPNSPIYSPNSPSYTPNYNISPQPSYKYIKPPVYAPNILQNFLEKTPTLPPPVNPLSSLTPPPFHIPKQVSSKTYEPSKSNSSSIGLKRPHSDSSKNGDGQPPEKQKKVQSLLNSCNINLPSSLSITLTNDNDDSSSNPLFSKKGSEPVNNYIEILKLDADDKKEEPKVSPSQKEDRIKMNSKQNNPKMHSSQHVASEKDMAKPLPDLNTKPNLDLNPASFQESYLQAIKTFNKPIIKNIVKKKDEKPKNVNHPPKKEEDTKPKPTKLLNGKCTPTFSPPKDSKHNRRIVPKPEAIYSVTQSNDIIGKPNVSQLSEIQQKALWANDPPQSLPAYLNEAARAFAQNNNFMSQLAQYQFWMRLQTNKAMESLLQQNTMNNNNVSETARDES